MLYVAFFIICFWIIVGIISTQRNKNRYSIKSRINVNDFKKFRARISFKDTWIFFVIFGGFFVIGVLFLSKVISGGTSSVSSPVIWLTDEQYIGAIITAFSSFALVIIGIKNFAIGSWYGVSLKGLLMVVNGRKNTIAFENINAISAIGAEQVSVMFNNLKKAEIFFMNTATYSPIRATLNEIDLLLYLSVPVVHTETSFFKRFNFLYRTSTNGSFVLLNMKDGKTFMISPKKIEAYLAEVSKYFNVQNQPISPLANKVAVNVGI